MASSVTKQKEDFSGKYESSGLIGRWLVSRFFGAVNAMVSSCLPQVSNVLEVGCGPGYSTKKLAMLSGSRRFVASDVASPLISQARRRNPETWFVNQSVFDLAHRDQSFDLVVMLEVLEHLDRPESALRELHRVCRKYLVISTPREPIWRALNCMRGKYLSDWGNTPGHLQHWSSSGLVKEVSPYFSVLAMSRPLPWTVLLLAPRS